MGATWPVDVCAHFPIPMTLLGACCGFLQSLLSCVSVEGERGADPNVHPPQVQSRRLATEDELDILVVLAVLLFFVVIFLHTTVFWVFSRYRLSRIDTIRR